MNATSTVRLLTAVSLAVALAPEAGAQGIPRRLLNRQPSGAPRIMVATPYAFASADSAAAVAIGRGMRNRVEGLVGRDFNVIADTIMNNALTQYGYSADAILTPQLAVTLAKQIQARYVVTSQLQKVEGGRFRVVARFVGINDEAGLTLTTEQQPQQRLDRFGEAAVAGFAPFLKGLDRARDCVNLRASNAAKASDAGQRALKDEPRHGLANFCLAQIAVDQKQPRPQIIELLEATVAGDSLSLQAWGLLASQYEQAEDTTRTLAAYQQILRVAPTNQKLREDIFKRFLSYGRPELARRVADEGLALDPYNADLYDLKSNACLFAEDYACALEALKQEFALDSTKADTLFYIKATAAAGARPDTAELLAWSRQGGRKYPDNVAILSALNRAWVLVGETDSSLAVTRRLMELDPEDTRPALAAAQTLVTAKRYDDVKPFADYVATRDQPSKDQLAGMFVAAANGNLQAPPDYGAAVALSRRALDIGGPQGRVGPQANLIKGIALFQVGRLQDSTESANKTWNCDGARQLEATLVESKESLQTGRSVSAELADRILGFFPQYFDKRVADLKRVLCK